MLRCQAALQCVLGGVLGTQRLGFDPADLGPVQPAGKTGEDPADAAWGSGPTESRGGRPARYPLVGCGDGRPWPRGAISSGKAVFWCSGTLPRGCGDKPPPVPLRVQTG